MARPAWATLPGPPHSQSGLTAAGQRLPTAPLDPRGASTRIIRLVDLAKEDVLLARVTDARAAACAAVNRYADLIARNHPLVGRLDERRMAERTMLSDLHTEMGNYAVALRELGTPPQEALVLLKHLAESESFQRVPSRSPVMLEVRSSLVNWFVAAYYSA